jgi:glycosyltransferase involved in cell wall biosynthesis
MSTLTAITPYGRDGSSSRIRVFEWLDRLVPNATVMSYSTRNSNSPINLAKHPLALIRAEWSLRALARHPHSRVLLHRRASPFGSGHSEFGILRAAQWSVYDFDDALQVDTVREGFRRLVTPSDSQKALTCVRTADRVIAGNEILADWAAQFARDVVVIPSCVDPMRYRAKTSYEIADPPRLVWVGSASTEKYLLTIAPALLELHRRTGARLAIIGQSSGQLRTLDAIIDRIPWAIGQPERQLADFDIGVAPLADDPWSRGKCGYKMLQYGAAAMPIITSPVGANRRIGEALGAALPQSTNDWLDHLLQLVSAPANERLKLGRASRRAVVSSYSFDAWRGSWLNALRLRPGVDLHTPNDSCALVQTRPGERPPPHRGTREGNAAPDST